MYLFYLRKCCLPIPRGDINLMRVVNRDTKAETIKRNILMRKKEKVSSPFQNPLFGKVKAHNETRDPKMIIFEIIRKPISHFFFQMTINMLFDKYCNHVSSNIATSVQGSV